MPLHCRVYVYDCHMCVLKLALAGPSLFFEGVVRRRTETCAFSGQKVFPGRGVRYVRIDARVRPSYS